MDIKNFVTRFSVDRFEYKGKKITGNVSFSSPCIGYVLKGQGSFLYNGKSHVAKSGDLVYIAAGTRYYSVWSGKPEVEWYSIRFSFSSVKAMSEYRFQLLENYPAQLFHDIYKSAEKDEFLCMSLFYKLIDDMHKKLVISEDKSSFKKIEPALEYIESHSSEEISIKQLSELCCCCESSLFKSFRDSLGISPVKYKHNIMIQNALKLLSDTDLSIEEISRRIGFSSSDYFRRIFISSTGTTPKKLRKK